MPATVVSQTRARGCDDRWPQNRWRSPTPHTLADCYNKAASRESSFRTADRAIRASCPQIAASERSTKKFLNRARELAEQKYGTESWLRKR
jgi:hypothetical protein